MKVIFYTAPGCPFCVIMQKFLERNSIQFITKDISKDETAKNTMHKISGQEKVPVIDINGEIIIGYNLSKLKEVLQL